MFRFAFHLQAAVLVLFAAAGCDMDDEDGGDAPAPDAAVQAGCDPDFCAEGCCAGDVCVIGDRNARQCGQGGAICMACGPGEDCVDGACAAVGGACDAEFCAEGCCAGDACVIGDRSAQQCGSGGLVCVACREGEDCVDGACEPIGGGCDAAFCAEGCCAGDVCVIGDRNAQQCGAGGQMCMACQPGEDCVDGTCQAVDGVCDAAFCAEGCCAGDVCVIGDRDAQQCGSGGQMCVACRAGEDCVNGVCQPVTGGSCACSTPGAMVGPGPGGCDFEDANACSGWQSVIIGSEDGAFTPEAEAEALNREVPDGTVFCAFDCCMQITCP